MFTKGKRKYNNHKFTDHTGRVWDSSLEHSRYLYLKGQLEKGAITDLQCQVTYTIIPRQEILVQRIGKRGTPIKPICKTLEKPATYRADFTYLMPDGTLVVEDTKSKITRTKEYRLKRKLMLYVHNIRIHEVDNATDPIPIYQPPHKEL